MATLALRVDVTPRLVEWAIQRSGRGYDYLAGRFPKLANWLDRSEQPTLRQLEAFAEATYTPIGYLFLREPPDEPLPLPDFRSIGDAEIASASANLLDTIYQCQIRQDWYRSWAAGQQAENLPFVGSLTLSAAATDAAEIIRRTLHFPVPASRQYGSWTAAVTGLADALGDAGILVMINGVVGTNTTRTLDPNEFRGFTLADPLAPLIFVNGADSKSAQMFTLVHEAGHVWLGASGVGDDQPGPHGAAAIERWCSALAAELLVPIEDFRLAFNPHRPLAEEVAQAARRYRVSSLVILTRAFEADFLSWDRYQTAFNAEKSRLQQLPKQGSGGNFYSTLASRLGKRFLRAVVTNTQAGETLYSDAFRMLGIKEQRVFDEIPTRIKLS